MPPDVSVIVLSLGESTLPRALASLEQQTVPPAEVILVEGAVPFHRAFNQGASQVRTPYFVQLDADMVLDPGCLEHLRELMTPTCACAVGHLRDPLMGRVVGIKMFNAELLRRVPFRDCVSPDTDCLDRLAELGFGTIYAVDYKRGRKAWHTLGLHDPTYAPNYVFCKFTLMGSRYRFRASWSALRWQVEELLRERHPLKDLGVVALAGGVARGLRADELKPYENDARVAGLWAVLSGGEDGSGPAWLAYLGVTPMGVYRWARWMGRHLRVSPRGCLTAWRASLHPYAWVAVLGYGQGLLERDPRTQRPDNPPAELLGPAELRHFLAQLRRLRAGGKGAELLGHLERAVDRLARLARKAGR